MRKLLGVCVGVCIATTLAMGQSYNASMSLSVTTSDSGDGPPVTVLIVDLKLQTITGPSARLGDTWLSVHFNTDALQFGGVSLPSPGYWVGGSYNTQQLNGSAGTRASVFIDYVNGDGLEIPTTPTIAVRIGFIVLDPTAPPNITWYTGDAVLFGTTIRDVNTNLLNDRFTFTNPPNISMLVGIVEPKVLLEGPYNPTTQLMDSTLKRNGVLAGHFSTVAIADSSVDSVTVEIRDAPSGATRYSKPAWLRTDGAIRAFNDTSKSYVEFPGIVGNYYIVIHHRNHLSVMSATAQPITNTSPVYDFSLAQSNAYGDGALKLRGSRYCMLAGDANGNGNVADTDVNDVIRLKLGLAGYINADINLNGQVQNSDINDFVRLNLGRGTQVP